MLEFTVPWPPKELSPNARKHWGARSKKAKQYRAQCFAYAHNALQAMAVDVAGKLVDDRAYNGAGYRKLVDELTPQVPRLKALFADHCPHHYTIADIW